MPLRALVAVAGTVAGLVLLFSFRTPDQPAAPGVALPAGAGPPPATATAAAGPSGFTPAGTPRSASSSSTSGAYRDGTFTGQDAPNQYGDVQVQAVVSGGRITDVKSVQLPFDRSRSAEISQIAGPMLHDEALQAQSAHIDVVSGATYTSDGYAQSLQSALDQAH